MKIKRALTILIPLLVVLGGWLFYQSSQFHIVSTEPDIGSVATISPFIKIKFNKTLSASKLSVSSVPSIITSHKIDNKTLTVNLVTPLNTSTKYQLTIHVSDVSGKLIDKVFKFSPKYTTYSQLNQDQKSAILNNQKNKPSQVTTTYLGFDSLISHGVSSSQALVAQQDILQFAQSTSKETPGTISVAPNSITRPPYDPNNPPAYLSINFNVAIDSTTYKAQLQFPNLTQARLLLFNQAGAQVYDSNSTKITAE